MQVEGHALNLRNHYWSQTADPTTLSFDTYVEDVVAPLHSPIGSGAVVVGHGMGGLLALKAAERMPMAGLVLLSVRAAARAARAGSAACPPPESPTSTDVVSDRLGDPSRAVVRLRDDRDLTLADAPPECSTCSGEKPHEAGAAPGARCWPACRWTEGIRRATRRRSSSVRGWTEPSRSPTRESWRGGWTRHTSRSPRIRITALSLVRTFNQVAQLIRGFLEAQPTLGLVRELILARPRRLYRPASGAAFV